MDSTTEFFWYDDRTLAEFWKKPDRKIPYNGLPNVPCRMLSRFSGGPPFTTGAYSLY